MWKDPSGHKLSGPGPAAHLQRELEEKAEPGPSLPLTSAVTTASKKVASPAAFKLAATCRRLPPVATAQGRPVQPEQRGECRAASLSTAVTSPRSPLRRPRLCQGTASPCLCPWATVAAGADSGPRSQGRHLGRNHISQGSAHTTQQCSPRALAALAMRATDSTSRVCRPAEEQQQPCICKHWQALASRALKLSRANGCETDLSRVPWRGWLVGWLAGWLLVRGAWQGRAGSDAMPWPIPARVLQRLGWARQFPT